MIEGTGQQDRKSPKLSLIYKPFIINHLYHHISLIYKPSIIYKPYER